MGGNPPQCTQRFHVCVPPAHVVDAKPCLSCDHWCHASSDDLLCPYHGQERGVLAWAASESDLMDSALGLGPTLPHRTQVECTAAGATESGLPIFRVLGQEYYVGTASGQQNNCLINSLRQCLALQVDVGAVRRELVREFGARRGRSRVDEKSYLELFHHGEPVLRLIHQHCSDGVVPYEPRDFCIVGINFEKCSVDEGRHGEVVGNRDARNHLVLACRSNVHFDPMLPVQTSIIRHRHRHHHHQQHRHHHRRR